MKFKAIPVKGKDLKPGDLFSMAGPWHWDSAAHNDMIVGEKVYIRTEAPCLIKDLELDLYRIEIDLEGER